MVSRHGIMVPSMAVENIIPLYTTKRNKKVQQQQQQQRNKRTKSSIYYFPININKQSIINSSNTLIYKVSDILSASTTTSSSSSSSSTTPHNIVIIIMNSTILKIYSNNITTTTLSPFWNNDGMPLSSSTADYKNVIFLNSNAYAISLNTNNHTHQNNNLNNNVNNNNHNNNDNNNNIHHQHNHHNPQDHLSNSTTNNTNLTTTPALSQVFLAPSTTAISSTSSTFINSTNSNVTETINSFYFYETEQFTVLWVLFIVIVLGNSAVLVTLFLNKNRKSRMNFFIKQLAIADLCVGLLNVLTDIVLKITVSWRAGNMACKFIKFMQACITYASTYVLVALSIDRYDAITHPMNFSGSWSRARKLVATAWAFSAIFSTPQIILYEEKVVEGIVQCWIDLGSPLKWQIYMSLVSTVLFVIPAIIIAGCHAIIVRTIWAKGAILLPTDNRSGDHGSRRASSRGIIPRAKVKTVKMTIVIVIVFIVCWSPYIIFDLLQVFGQIPMTQTNTAIATFIQSLAPLNSAANPLIYCLFSTQICRALKRIPPFRWVSMSWCCCIPKNSKNNSLRCNMDGGGGGRDGGNGNHNNTANGRYSGGNNHRIGGGGGGGGNGSGGGGGRSRSSGRLRNSSDSVRTLTTSLTLSRRSATSTRPARVVIVERPKAILAMSEV